jgi:hypothetical protein
MFKLEKSLRAWGTPDFESILKQEVVGGAQHLPLQQGLASCNYVADTPVTLLIQRVAETEKVIRIKAGIFYQGIIGGCSCTDDPTPASEITEYCVVQLDIDKATAATAVALVGE